MKNPFASAFRNLLLILLSITASFVDAEAQSKKRQKAKAKVADAITVPPGVPALQVIDQKPEFLENLKDFDRVLVDAGQVIVTLKGKHYDVYRQEPRYYTITLDKNITSEELEAAQELYGAESFVNVQDARYTYSFWIVKDYDINDTIVRLVNLFYPDGK